MNNATHYAYINNIKEYFKLYFDLHTNIPRCAKYKDGAWFLVKDMDLSGLTMIEVKK